MSERDAIIESFIVRAGWSGAMRKPLAGDASFRRYERVTQAGTTAILMDAPPPKEDVRPFVAMTRHLRGLGYSAPELLAEDVEAGLLLLEDLGDATYGRALADGADKMLLYEAAVDFLADLHARPESATVPTWLAPYDDVRLLTEAELLTDWYMPRVFGRPTPPAAKRAYQEIWRALMPTILASGRTLVMRDFFADNLVWLPTRPDIRKVGVLDYQDALAGSPAYDLMSLIEDARRDTDPALETRLLERYSAQRPSIDHAAFRAAYVALAAQRHCKVIGIFTRLCVRDGKPAYLAHIPRLWRLLERACRDPLMAPLNAWLAEAIPAEKRTMLTPEPVR